MSRFDPGDEPATTQDALTLILVLDPGEDFTGTIRRVDAPLSQRFTGWVDFMQALDVLRSPPPDP